MSILSCNRFRCGSYFIDVIEKKRSLEIRFEDAPVEGTTSSNSITVTNASQFQPGQAIQFQGNGANDIAIDANGYPILATATGSLYSHMNQFKTTGYRLFMCNGFLKCVKMSLPMYYFVTTVTGTTASLGSTPKSQKVHESFFHPASICEYSLTDECREYIRDQILLLAAKSNVSVPQYFHECGVRPVNHGSYIAPLDWLTYPIIRELDSVTVCRNMSSLERDAICPKFEPLNFKQLVEHYYQTSTPKMLSEIWKAVVIGDEYTTTHFQIVAQEALPFVGMRSSDIPPNMIKVDERVQIGNKQIQREIFSFGPAIFETMGFDYFYQALIYFQNRQPAGPIGQIGIHGSRSPLTRAVQFELVTLLKHISPKKLLSILLSEDVLYDIGNIHDTARMLRDYENIDSIPKTLKLQYPTGLTVDFKFKTLKELHDKISTQYTIIKAEESKRDIGVAPIYASLDGRSKNGLTLKVPFNTSTLAVWGNLLSICIASYGDRAARGDTLLLGVEKDGQIKYCIEFHSLKVKQTNEDGTQSVIEVYPKLIKKVTLASVSEEEETFYVLSTVQFRSLRNGNPEKEDKEIVEALLTEWAKENIEFLGKLKGIFNDGNYLYGGAALNEEMLQHAANQAMQNVGVPDQLLIPREQADNYYQIFRNGVADREVNIAQNQVAIAAPIIQNIVV